jgi:protein-tyrosine phosphatase
MKSWIIEKSLVFNRTWRGFMSNWLKSCGALILVCLFASPSQAKNLHLIDEDTQSGFAIYRMGAPGASDMRELCTLGVEEVLVLSGDAKKHEEKYAKECPSLKVILEVKQNPDKPVTAEFLETFDKWVQSSQNSGKKIAFRCSCGCHRTGRLAAYYQMKYQHITSTDAIAIMMKHGKWMFLHPSLDNQVHAMEQYIKGTACTEGKYCVRTEKELSSFDFPVSDEEEDGQELH